MHRRAKALTIKLAKRTKQTDGAGDEVLDLSEDLRIDLDITSLDWLVHAEAREVVQPLEPGGHDVGVCVQCGGSTPIDVLGTGVIGDGNSPLVHPVADEGPETIDGFGTEEPPLIGRESKVGATVQVQTEVENGAGVIREVQREVSLRNDTSRLEHVPDIRQGNRDWE